MIFPPESVYEFRRELVAKMESGALSDAEAFRQALAVDPHDPAATRYLALFAEKSGDREQAVQLAHRAIEANPTSHECYLLLGRVLSDPPLAQAYAALGKEKLHFDPEALAEVEPDDLAEPALRESERPNPKQSPANWSRTAFSTNSSLPDWIPSMRP